MTSTDSFISGMGSHLPSRVVTSDELRAQYGIHTAEQTGIRERRYADEGVGAGDLAVPASKAAIADAGLQPRDIDIIFMATLSGEQAFPGSSVFLQRQLGVLEGDEPKPIAAMDIRDQAAGFLFALSAAKAMVAAGGAKHALVVGSEVHSALLDFSSAASATTPLFGDGAGAVVVSARTDASAAAGRGVRHVSLGTDARGTESFFVNLWRVRNRPYLPLKGSRESDASVPRADLWPRMDVDTVLTAAVDRIATDLAALVAREGMAPNDLDLVIMQQTSATVGDRVFERLGLPRNKLVSNVEKYADTGSAAIPIALVEAQRDGRLQRGMKVALVAFGAGYVWGSALVDW